MNREKFPERVPFRLTRMLVKAMEVSGIEGNFRSTCENVMAVLRQNKDSVMAMMEVSVGACTPCCSFEMATAILFTIQRPKVLFSVSIE